jgi:hypothetical protein
MKKIIAAKIMCVVLLAGCGVGTTTSSIRTNTAAATKEALGIVPQGEQKMVANYLDVAAQGAYSLVGNLTGDQAAQKVLAFIPDSVKTKYPAIPLVLTPIVVFAYNTYGSAGMKDFGLGIEDGCSSFIGPVPTATP